MKNGKEAVHGRDSLGLDTDITHVIYYEFKL